MTAIDSFHKPPYGWLSNFWPCKVRLDGQEYASVEHAYQAAKYPIDQRGQFIGCTAGEAKRRGRAAKLPLDWEAKKIDIMASLIAQKFSQGVLALALKSTSDAELIEGNTWGDTFWGVCNGVGKNHLGKLLMEHRKVLIQQDLNGRPDSLYSKPNNHGLSGKQDNRDETVPTAVRQEQETPEADHGGLQAQVRELP